MTLTFSHLREVNVARCVEGWHHPIRSWTPADWLVAVAGELGEALNVAKKLNRERDGIIGNLKSAAELRADFADELADTAIYLDLLLASESLRPFAEVELTPRGLHRLSGEVGDSLSDLGCKAVVSLGGLAKALYEDGPHLRHRPVNIYAAAEGLLDVLDELAARAEVDLAEAIVSKFNRTSEKHGMPHRLVLS
jgi:NTP pyrophosphatase (non-canonical NTP hydrolase)